jgi:hypothetical protein
MSEQNTLETQEKREYLSSEDKTVFDAVKQKLLITKLTAEKVLAESQAADLAYQNVLLRLAMKYNLKDGDNINEDGELVRK